MPLTQLNRLPLPMGWLPQATIRGIRQTLPSHWILVNQNKQAHINDVDVLATGCSHLDGNPNTDSVIPARQRSTCLHQDEFDYCANRGGFENLTLDQVDVFAQMLCDCMDRGSNVDAGVGMISGQLNEANITSNNTRNTLRLSWKIGQIQSSRGFYYSGHNYDGFLRYNCLYDGQGSNVSLSLTHLASKESILAYLRDNGAPFQNKAFQPHTIEFNNSANNLAVRGGAIYHMPLMQIYTSGLETAGYPSALAAVSIMLGRNALYAIADELKTDNSFYHTTEQRTTLKATRVAIFGWNALGDKQGGGIHERVRLPVPGGYLSSLSFQINSYAEMIGVNVAALAEENGEVVINWDDIATFAHTYEAMPNTTSEMEYVSEGTSYPLRNASDRHQPDNVLVSYQIQQKGLGDVVFDAAQLMNKFRTWIGNFAPLPYADLKATNHTDTALDDTTFCSTYTRETYVFRRYKTDQKPWGYKGYDPVSGNVALIVMNYQLAPHLSHVISTQFNGITVSTLPIYGGQCTLWIGRIATNV